MLNDTAHIITFKNAAFLMINLDTLVKDINNIAIQAGEAILEIYNASGDIEYSKKDDNSPLTKADGAANTVICAGLEALEVVYPILSEENKEIPYSERVDFDRFWVVDPLDGTKEFIKRNGEFTVNIALVENGRPILGVVYTPVTKELFYGVQGSGAFRSVDGEVAKMEVNKFSKTDEGLRIVCSRSHLNEETQQFVDSYTTPDLVSKGSSLKFMILAVGDADLYPRLAPTMEWDTCAAQIILEEAGGSVINNETGLPVVYNKENLLNPHFIAIGGLTESSLT